MKKLCVFCGSASGNSPAYLTMAHELGAEMAKRQIALVYGGATIGVMGTLADSVLSHGGTVIGVIPKTLVDYEIAHTKLTEMYIVEGMHERKKLMYDKSDAFLSLPGGMGTLDEMFEILTWSQLKLHNKSCYLYNFQNYYDSLLDYLRHANREGFVKHEHLAMLKEIKDSTQLKAMLQSL